MEQPSCGQCRKACIPCEGYDKCLIIHRYYDSKQGLELSRVEGNDNTQSRLQLSPTPRTLNSQAQSPSSEIIRDHVTFPRAALEYALEGMFWDSYLTNSRCSSLLDNNQRTLGGSISVVRDLLPHSALLRIALGALALRSAASVDGKPHSMKQHFALMYFLTSAGMHGQKDARTHPHDA